MTNRERINKMSDEQLVKEIIYKNCSLCANQNRYEECGLGGDPLSIDCENGIMEWLKWDAELTADEMFKEIGYGNPSQDINIITYQSKETKNGKEKGIKILERDGKWLYSVFWYSNIEKQTNDHDIAYITEEENKAIQKKIEELKEEEKDDKN